MPLKVIASFRRVAGIVCGNDETKLNDFFHLNVKVSGVFTLWLYCTTDISSTKPSVWIELEIRFLIRMRDSFSME